MQSPSAMPYFDQSSSASSQSPYISSSDEMSPPPVFAAPSKSQAIDIAPVTTAQQPAERPSSRRRRDNVQFRDVHWGAKHQAEQEHEQIALSYQRLASPARSGGSSKRKEFKESGIFRRTSVSCRNKFQKAIAGRSRRSSFEAIDGMQATTYEPGTSTSPLQHKSTFIDRLAHPNRMLSNLKVSRFDTPAPIAGPSSTNPAHMLRPQYSESQLYDSQFPYGGSFNIPYDTRAGAAARKAAAAAAKSPSKFQLPTSPSPSAYNYRDIREQNRRRLGSNSSAADSGADICSSDVEMVDAADLEVEGVDPLTRLPFELNALIFSHLDAAALRACQRVNSPWKSLASDPLIWRDEYLRNFNQREHVTPAPVQIGGVGIGKPGERMQNWKLMHRAREQINANWNAGKGRAIYMAGHTDSVYCVQFDEQKIITGSRDRTIRVWDLNSNRCIKVIGGPMVKPVPGPRVLRTVDYPSFHHAEASVNGTPYGDAIYHQPSDFHSASILCLQYDDEILVTGSSDNDLIVWDIKTYEPIRRLKHHSGGVLDVAFDSEHIVSCSKDCSIVVWDRKTLMPIRTLTGHEGPVNAVQLRGNLLVSASGDGHARLWDLTKLECVREFPAKERGLAAVEFSDDAKYVLAGGNDHVTYKFEVATGKEVLQYTGHSQLVRSLFLDTQNKRVVSGSYDLDLRVYDYETGKSITVFQEWTTSWMLAAKCDYRRIVSASQDGRILMIDFGINQDGEKIHGVDLLAGREPRPASKTERLYPRYNHNGGPVGPRGPRP